MGTKRTSSEGAVKKAAKLPPKRKSSAGQNRLRRQPALRDRNPKRRQMRRPQTQIVRRCQPIWLLCGYFISENRRKDGVEGDPLADWLEAERQITSRAAKGFGSDKRI